MGQSCSEVCTMKHLIVILALVLPMQGCAYLYNEATDAIGTAVDGGRRQIRMNCMVQYPDDKAAQKRCRKSVK